MKNNTAILDCVTKYITFKFKNELFTVNILEGDLCDSWNSITTKDGEVFDFNFSWEDTKGEKPYLTIYSLIDDEDGVLSTNHDDFTIIKIGKSDRDIFFKEARFGYYFDVESKITCRLYDENDVEVFKTSSFNRACDEKYIRTSNGEKIYMVIMDKNNATKRI